MRSVLCRWLWTCGSGLARSFQYEAGQSRIGGSIWEYPMRFIENSPLFWLDKVTTPLFIILTVLLAVVGLGVRTYYTYQAEMAVHDADAPWARGARGGKPGPA